VPDTDPAAISAARRLLTALLSLTFLYGVGVLALFLAGIVAPDATLTALGVRPAPDRGTMVVGMRIIMVLGLIGAPVAYRIFFQLRAIVDTVSAGDPFVRANALRLRRIAWSVLGLEILHLAVGLVAARSATSVQPLDIDWSLSLTPWVAILLLFVLARVFEHGAAMRADLEGTI
jgi:Protein of unknown function (DUF2975)